jgi:hypothetical protein
MAEYTIVAESPGDIVVTFTSSADGTLQTIPLKSISAQKSIDVSSEYGTGNHQKYAHVQGKIDYQGDFEIGSWWVSDAENPETWMDLIKEHLSWNGVQGLSREFTIMIADNGAAYDRSLKTAGTPGGAAIVTFNRCLLKQDSLSVGEPGSTVSTKYSWTAMSRSPP